MAENQVHPLLERAGIDDVMMEIDFDEVGMMSAPDLTYQYSEDGELDTSLMSTQTPLCEDAPAIYREQFIRRWTVGGRVGGKPDLKGEVCWERLRELYSKVMRDLPDNERVLEHAWIIGLVPDMPPRLRAWLDRLNARVARHLAEQGQDAEVARRAKETGERQVLRSYLTDHCCNGNSSECSFDNATEFVLPDGSHQTEYRCCH